MKAISGTTLACTLALLSGIAFTGCSPSPQERAKEVAVKALEASVDRPGTIKVHAVSKADSVFGRDYVSQEEKMVIATAMMKINRKIMKETDSFKDFDIRDRERPYSWKGRCRPCRCCVPSCLTFPLERRRRTFPAGRSR